MLTPLGVQLPVAAVALGVTLGRLLMTVPGLVGVASGLGCRSGAGDAGDCGRRNGELRVCGEPKPKGEGL